MFWLVAFFEISVTGAGFRFLNLASSPTAFHDVNSRIPALISGGLCLTLVASILILVLMRFPGRPPAGE